jgi:hypothetical protein
MVFMVTSVIKPTNSIRYFPQQSILDYTCNKANAHLFKGAVYARDR